jgi:peptidoglycan-N-acetylglucosamine deacetylase
LRPSIGMNTNAIGHHLVLALLLVAAGRSAHAQTSPSFSWPDGARAAVSLSFDDARPSQVDVGLPILDRNGVKATFFLVPSNAGARQQGWKQAVANGHEIGSHSLDHPCTGNFAWSRAKALEVAMLETLLLHLRDPANGYWVASVGAVARYIAARRSAHR